jgi:Tol biopolymer transport system component
MASSTHAARLVRTALALAVALSAATVAQAEPAKMESGLIAFDRTQGTDGVSRIFTMNASGGALQAITAASDSSSHPDWSPDGTSMVFERRRSGGHSPYGTELYSVNVDGTGLRRLADCRENCVGDGQPVYSPDGGRVAFIRSYGPLVEGVYPDRRSVVAVNADGSGLQEILSFDVLRDRRIPQDPQWSPDGRKLSLTVYTDASTYGLDVGVFTVNVDGSELRRLVPFTSFDADWAPDAKRIAFTIAYGASSPDGVDVYTARSNGAQLRRLTRNGRRLTSLSPTWSPDGTRIAFVRMGRGERGFSDLYSMRANGSGLRRLTRTPFGEGSPSWGARSVLH